MSTQSPEYVYDLLSYLTPDTRRAWEQLESVLHAHGLATHIIQTFRTQERQDQLAQIGASQMAAGKAPVTITDQSWHNVGRALDVSVIPATSKGGASYDNVDFFLDAAEKIGFTTNRHNWGRTMKNGYTIPKYWDWHHISFRGGRTWEQAHAEYAQLGKGPVQSIDIGQAAIGTVGGIVITNVVTNVLRWLGVL